MEIFNPNTAFFKRIKERLKHLPGRHNQLDHAWNRGMGMSGQITAAQFKAMVKDLGEQVERGEINEETARLTALVLRKKANDYHDAMVKLSLGMMKLPKRRELAMQARSSAIQTFASNSTSPASGAVDFQILSSPTNTDKQIETAKAIAEEVKQLYREISEMLGRSKKYDAEYDALTAKSIDNDRKINNNNKRISVLTQMLRNEDLSFEERRQMFNEKTKLTAENRALEAERADVEKQIANHPSTVVLTENKLEQEYEKYRSWVERNGPDNPLYAERLRLRDEARIALGTFRSNYTGDYPLTSTLRERKMQMQNKIEEYKNAVHRIHPVTVEQVSEPRETIRMTMELSSQLRTSPMYINAMDSISGTFTYGADQESTVLQGLDDYLDAYLMFGYHSNTIANAIHQLRADLFSEDTRQNEEFSEKMKEIISRRIQEFNDLMDETNAIEKQMHQSGIRRYEKAGLTDEDYYRDYEDTNEAYGYTPFSVMGTEKPTNVMRFPGDDAEIDAVMKLHAKWKELREQTKIMSGEIYDMEAGKRDRQRLDSNHLSIKIFSEIFDSMIAENPISVDFQDTVHTASQTTDEFTLDQRRNLIRKVLSVIPDYDGNPFEVIMDTYSGSDPRASASAIENGNQGTLHSGPHDAPYVIVHETLHFIQQTFPELQQYLDSWAENRVKSSGEKIRTLNEILQTTRFADHEVSVVDSVDDPYTLKKYTGYMYAEILTMAFNDLARRNFITSDPEHLRVALHALLQFLPVARPKTKSFTDNNTRIKNVKQRMKNLSKKL